MRNVVADKKTKGELGFDRPKKKNFNDLDGRNGCLALTRIWVLNDVPIDVDRFETKGYIGMNMEGKWRILQVSEHKPWV